MEDEYQNAQQYYQQLNQNNQNLQNNTEEQYQSQNQNDIQNQNQYIYQADLNDQVNIYEENQKQYINEYQITDKILGQGSYGQVKLVMRNFYDDNQQPATEEYAIKIFNKNILEKYRLSRQLKNQEIKMLTQLDILYEEMALYQYLDHQNICKLFQIIDDIDHENLYFILDFCDLGQICEWDENQLKYKRNEQIIQFITKKYNISNQKIQENDKNQNQQQNQIIQVAKIIFFQIIQGVKYLHELNIVNRDIKPDNILCKSNQNIYNNDIKIADFSTARQLEQEDELIFDCVGTAGLRPPEMQFSTQEGYLGKPADIWSIGITMYCFVNENMPWWGESELEMDIKAKKEEIQYDSKLFPQELQDLINKMCQKNQKDRITIQECENHPFFKN